MSRPYCLRTIRDGKRGTPGARGLSCAVSARVSSAFGRTRVGLRPTKRSFPSHARKKPLVPRVEERWLAFNSSILKIVPIYITCEQRFLLRMVFSVHEVVCVACLSRNWQTKYRKIARNVCSLRLLFLGHRSYTKNKTQTAVINMVNFDPIFSKFDASYASQHIFSKVI